MSLRLGNTERRMQHSSLNSIDGARTPDGDQTCRHTSGLVDGNGDADEGFDVDFYAIAVGHFLDVDPRPTFVIDRRTNLGKDFESTFANAALRSNHHLAKAVLSKSRPDSPLLASTLEFRAWMDYVVQHHRSDISSPPTLSYCDHVWSAFTLHERWVVISGCCTERDSKGINLPPLARRPNKVSRQQVGVGQEDRITLDMKNEVFDAVHRLQASFVSTGTPDSTLAQPEGFLSPHVMFARSIDWASTPLGDMSTWSAELRQIANLLMSNPHPAAVFWGEELTVIYNKAYADGVAGQKHPELMGTGFRGHFEEVWGNVGTIFNESRETGKAVAVENQMLPIERRGFGEETYFTWSLTPLYGGTSQLLGLYNALFETTRQTINDRRTRTLLNLGAEVALAKSVSEFWRHVLNALRENEYDFPFALLYSVVDDIDGDEGASMSSETSSALKSCILEGTLGVPEGHPAAPTGLDLRRATGGFIPAFRDALQTREPKLLSLIDGTLSETMIEGLECRGFGDPCRLAVVCPIRPTNGENVLGFLVVGINPRRPYDGDYEAFIRLLNRQLATSLASVELFEDEIRRGNTAAKVAALERSRLSEELAVQRGRLQRIAEVASVGMFSIEPNGLLLGANDRWFEMTGHPRDRVYEMSFMETIAESSRQAMEMGWRRLTIDGMPWSGELQMKQKWYDPATGEEHDNWMLAAAQPEYSAGGTVKIIMGSLTDITAQKRSAKDAEARARLSEELLNLQKERLEEAEETRRQQNNFIDMTSHEMRNPLSAIVQCADSISTSMNEIYNNSKLSLEPALKATIKTCIEASDTIQLCAQHQKSIVDDILTISKLDSNLLLITPMPIELVKVVQQTLRMFMAECTVHDITMNLHLEKSLQELNVDWVMLDSSRLLQVLINLLTNAIKFTKSEKKRLVDVSIGAYLEPPAVEIENFRYFPTHRARADITAGADWGTGEILYLRFEVRDTGCGLNDSEKKNLFTRFSQASPRTHVKYGGSGLGLFISRQLTELQGGEIGVASEAGVGSAFAFYLKARRPEGSAATPPTTHQRNHSDLESNSRVTSLREKERPVSNPRQFKNLATYAPEPPNILLRANPKDWHVLIVEDNLVNQRILATQISNLGCTTYVANHGGEALDLIQESAHYKGKERDGKHLSVILMDLEMPIMDGLTCTRKIREMEGAGLIYGRIPIIAVTANARDEQIANAKLSGIDDVMPKPFRIRQLVPKIDALLHKMVPEP